MLGATTAYGREFRYDGARQRYLNRELDPVALLSEDIVVLSETWSDYDGDEVYADFTIDGSTATVQTWYEPGVARSDDPLNPAGTHYYHTNHLGTTRLMSDATGLATGESVYTAFGELEAGNFHRYGYVGAHGYQTHSDFPFQHVGYRYYDPATGRFLQRDPIGINGGVNVYGYVNGRPVSSVDPEGLQYCPQCDAMYYRKNPPPKKPFRPRPAPQYRDSWKNRFWNHRDWSWLDDPKKVKRVDKGARIVAGACMVYGGVYGGFLVIGGNAGIGVGAGSSLMGGTIFSSGWGL